MEGNIAEPLSWAALVEEFISPDQCSENRPFPVLLIRIKVHFCVSVR